MDATLGISWSNAGEFPDVPEFVIDRFRNRVDTTGLVWRICDPSRPVSLNWELMQEGELRTALQLWICRCIRRLSPGEAQNQYQDIKAVLTLPLPRPTALDGLDMRWWRSVRSALENMPSDRRYIMHRARAWFEWMADQGWVDEDTAFEIATWSIPGNEKGQAVARRDKDSGPLDDVQFNILWQSVLKPQPATNGQAATMICLDLGPNAKSLALLEERDLKVYADPKSGKKRYALAVPRIKKQKNYRETKLRPISPATGVVIEALIAENQSTWGPADPKRPIFCRTRPVRSDADGMQRFPLHCTSQLVSAAVIGYAKTRDLRVPGSGDTDFHVTPRRLRYTYATRLAIEGASAVMIAELLDHTDLQNVMVYIEAAGHMVNILSTALGPALTPTVDRFMGRMVDKPEEAVPNDPAKHIPAKVSGGMIGHIGTCGCGSLCRSAPPFGCYRCAHFQPWSVADHEGLRDNLMRIRDLVRAGDRTGAVSGVFDETLQAVESVIALKNKRACGNAT